MKRSLSLLLGSVVAASLLLALPACEPELPEETNLAHNRVVAAAGAGGAAGGGGGGGGGAAGKGGGTGGVGYKCSADAECTGYDKPSCLTQIQPLKGKITDPMHPQASKFENELVMPFPNGYCTTKIDDSCKNDAACGDGGGCFRGLDGVDKATLEGIDAMKGFLPFSTVAFADVGICLKPCKTDAECRKDEGYTCAVPMGTLIQAINPGYTKTFCVGPFTFMLLVEATRRQHMVRSNMRMARWAVATILVAAVASCSNAGGVPPDDQQDTDGQKLGGGGSSGSAGSTGGGSAGTSGTSSGKGGSSTGGSSTGGSSTGGSSTGGSSTGGSSSCGSTGTCPPTSFCGLPACGNATIHACLKCACNDTDPKTLCSAKYAACRADAGCSKTVECVLSGCAVASCEALVGQSLQLLLDLQPCLQTVCPSQCSGLIGSGGASGSGGSGTGGSSTGGASGAGGGGTVCTAGAFSCNGTKLQKCDAGGASYSLVQDCASGTVCDAAMGKCTTGSGCGQGWTITYGVTGQYAITGTTLGAGDKSGIPLGPGELAIRFEDVGGNPGGKAKLLSYSMPHKFNVTTMGLSVTTDVLAAAAFKDCGVASGTLTGMVLGWDMCKYGSTWNTGNGNWKPDSNSASGPGCITDFTRVGNVNCTDNATLANCSNGNLKDGDNPQNEKFNQPLNSFEMSADLKTFKMRGLGGPSTSNGGDKGVEMPTTSPSRTWFNLDGTEKSRAKAPAPCGCN